MARPRKGTLDWDKILLEAAAIVKSYDTGVTLRQLYYRLVATEWIPNTSSSYKTLSRKSAELRRQGRFPDLIDRTRAIEQHITFDSPIDAYTWLTKLYWRDRTEGQEYSIYLGVEKHGMVVQLSHWFGDLGLPILALGGYSSQTFVDVVSDDVIRQDRPSVLLYAGDFDPSGVDIDRDFLERTAIFDHVRRIALREEHVEEYNLPPLPGKDWDARATNFIAKYGELIQVELDALPPEDMKKLYQAGIDEFWTKKPYEEVLEEEEGERETLEDGLEYLKLDEHDFLRARLRGMAPGTLEEMRKFINSELRKRRRGGA